jgi:uncharacterized protein with gpF-like domain
MPDIPEPTEAIRFLERKNLVPTDRWDDLKWGEHAHAFTVAHSTEADILNTLHGLMADAIKNGEAYGTWRNKALELMKSTGWYGGNGHTADDKKYISWRLRIIYDTNMRTAYSAAQYRKQLQDAQGRPVWVYKSKLSGKNRRQEHIALHDKAFRYDDPFWDTYYPPNGWGCQCAVTTKSEAGAKREGITVGDSTKETLPEIDETWAYNAGREALAPNFSKYENLPQDTVKHIYAHYRKSMDTTKTTKGEFRKIIERANEADYKPLNINYEVGNLEGNRFAAMRKAGVMDSKIMATDHDLHHSTGHKNAKQKVPESLFDDVYTMLQEPEKIFREIHLAHPGQEKVFHLVKETKGGKKIKIIVHVKTLKTGQTTMQVRTIGYADYDYTGANYDELKW